MRKFLLALLLIITGLSSFTVKPKVKTVLVILAHPDDESAIAQVLVKWAKTHKVFLIIATDGRYGARFDYKPGDELAAIREKETGCACEILGIQPPVFLKFHEDIGLNTGIGEYHKKSEALAEKIKAKIEEINPDVIFTFGPDGDTGHWMHRQISNTTTQIILSEGWVKRYPLYYLAWAQKDSDKLKSATGLTLNTVHPEYYNLEVSFSQEDEDKALTSLNCYVSQLSKEEQDQWMKAEKDDATNKLYFRRFAVSKEKKNSF
jgi:LmbE family N-acetylglucosaminyl deacetylase